MYLFFKIVWIIRSHLVIRVSVPVFPCVMHAVMVNFSACLMKSYSSLIVGQNGYSNQQTCVSSPWRARPTYVRIVAPIHMHLANFDPH